MRDTAVRRNPTKLLAGPLILCEVRPQDAAQVGQRGGHLVGNRLNGGPHHGRRLSVGQILNVDQGEGLPAPLRQPLDCMLEGLAELLAGHGLERRQLIDRLPPSFGLGPPFPNHQSPVLVDREVAGDLIEVGDDGRVGVERLPASPQPNDRLLSEVLGGIDAPHLAGQEENEGSPVPLDQDVEGRGFTGAEPLDELRFVFRIYNRATAFDINASIVSRAFLPAAASARMEIMTPSLKTLS